jgi:hypothetical protein
MDDANTCEHLVRTSVGTEPVYLKIIYDATKNFDTETRIERDEVQSQKSKTIATL